MKKPEILAPAGSYESVTAAVNAGCDALYIGGKSFNARYYADNPSDDDLEDIINICHLRGVKVFITLNILYKEREIENVIEFVNNVYSYGADGLIIQDIGMIGLVRKYFPNIAVSVSTQMTVHNREGVRLFGNMGCKRIVLARELSLEDIRNITAVKEDTEIEVFAHGALCVCYSGRCLMSSIIGGRSGNRGRCAQPCRMEYSFAKDDNVIKKGHLLSPKDIAAIDILDDIAALGVDSLKIEGRMKSPEYVYETVSVYRKYIDSIYKGNKLDIESEDEKNLRQIFNRGGESSQGYFNCFSGESMMSASPKSSGIEIGKVADYNSRNNVCKIKLYEDVIPGDGIEIWAEKHIGTAINKRAAKGDIISVNIKGRIKRGDRVFRSFDKALNDRLKKTYASLTRKMKVNVTAKVDIDETYIEFTDYGIKVQGEKCQSASNRPLTEEDIISRLSKTGDTPFEFVFTKCTTGDNIYAPVSMLNNLRRNACEKLSEHIIKSSKREKVTVPDVKKERIKAKRAVVTAKVRTADQLNACVRAGVKRIYAEYGLCSEENYNMCREKGIELVCALPYIAREGYQKYIDSCKNCGGYLMRSYCLVKSDKTIYSDYSLNVMNSVSIEAVRNIYGSVVTLSPELNMKELSHIADENCEIAVYGRLPLMTTHQCPVGLYKGHKGKGKYCKMRNSEGNYSLIDRTNAKFPVIRDCDECAAFILNCAPVYILNKKKELMSIGAGYMRMEFTVENYNDTFEIAKEHINVIEKDAEPSDIKFVTGEVTGGHFNRGVL